MLVEGLDALRGLTEDRAEDALGVKCELYDGKRESVALSAIFIIILVRIITTQ